MSGLGTGRLVIGVVLVADGIGWFLGHPLLPIESG